MAVEQLLGSLQSHACPGSRPEPPLSGTRDRAAGQETAARFRARHAVDSAQQLGVAEADLDAVLPARATQAGMAAAWRCQPGAAAYVGHTVLRLAAGTDATRLRASNAVLASHGCFRLVFVAVGGGGGGGGDDDGTGPLRSACSRACARAVGPPG